MNRLHLGRSIEIETLEIEWVKNSELRLAGTLSTTTAQDEFVKQLEVVHEHVLAGKIPCFTVDVRRLHFVNSSVIRVFVNWIARADRAAYKLRFLTDRTITWHRLSFAVLKSLAPNTVEIVDTNRYEAQNHGTG